MLSWVLGTVSASEEEDGRPADALPSASAVAAEQAQHRRSPCSYSLPE